MESESEVISMLLGSFVNGIAILTGSAVGLFLRFILRRSSRSGESGRGLGERLQKIVMQGLALCTMYIGISGALKGQNTLIAILSLVIGAVIGELLDLDGAMNRAGNWVQKKVSRPGSEGNTSTVADGFVAACLLFGVGVPFSAIAVFAYEALVTLAASVLAPLLSDVVIAEMTSVGSLMIIGLSLNILELTKIKVMNFIPAVFLPILLCRFM